MEPVEEFVRLKDAIRALEDRAQALRASFLKPGARLRSNRHQVDVKHQTRRVFQKDRLPAAILNDPRYWEETASTVVSVREIGTPAPHRPSAPARQADNEPDLVLIEPFDLPPPPRPLAASLPRSSGGGPP